MYRGDGLGATDLTEGLTRVAVQTAMAEKSEKVDAILDHADQTLYRADAGIDTIKWAVGAAGVLAAAYYLSRLARKRRP